MTLPELNLDNDLSATSAEYSAEISNFVDDAAKLAAALYYTNQDDTATEKIDYEDKVQSFASRAPKNALVSEVPDLSNLNAKHFHSNSTLLQEWEGYVSSLNDESFTAFIRDLMPSGSNEDEYIEVPLNILRDNDRRRITPGAIFRWSISYTTSQTGITKRNNNIVFRHLPAWTKVDLSKAEQEAMDIANALVWE